MKIDPAWKIEEPDNLNIAMMLAYSPEYYQKRLEKLGFTGKNKVLLDAGCGSGPWSAAAAKLVGKVYGIDLTKKYLDYARQIQKALKINNLQLEQGNIEKLPYRDRSIDYLICYSVWMFVDKEKALAEFHRVLKPGGQLYLGSLIGPAWYPKLIWQGLKEGNRGLIIDSLRAMRHRVPLKIESVKSMLEYQGFKVIETAADSEAGNNKIKIKPIYSGSTKEIFEVITVKPLQNTKRYKNTKYHG